MYWFYNNFVLMYVPKNASGKNALYLVIKCFKINIIFGILIY